MLHGWDKPRWTQTKRGSINRFKELSGFLAEQGIEHEVDYYPSDIRIAIPLRSTNGKWQVIYSLHRLQTEKLIDIFIEDGWLYLQLGWADG